MFYEKTLSSTRIFEGKVFSVRKDTVELENGTLAFREVIEHSGGVGILAVGAEGHIFLVRQFRYGVGRESLEIPAGKLEPGENPFACAQRELEEETGYVAGHWDSLGTMDSTPAYDSEVIHLYLARDLRPTSQRLDAGEFLSVEPFSMDKLLELCLNGGLTDAKTLVAVLKYQTMRAGGQI